MALGSEAMTTQRIVQPSIGPILITGLEVECAFTFVRRGVQYAIEDVTGLNFSDPEALIEKITGANNICRPRRKKCDLNDPSTWEYNKEKLKEHTHPLCDKLGKLCFDSETEAMNLTMITLTSKGLPVVPSVTHRKSFGSQETGISKGHRVHTVAAIIRTSCNYHGYPDDDTKTQGF